MPVRSGLKVVGLLTAEITDGEYAQNDEQPAKAKLHMGVQAIIYLCDRNYEPVHYPLGNMACRYGLPSSFTVTDATRRSLVPQNDPARPGFRLARATPDES